MLRTPGVLSLGAAHDLPVVTIADLVAWRQRHDRVTRVADTVLPTRHGTFRTVAPRKRSRSRLKLLGSPQ